MIFWIFVILTVIGIAVAIATTLLSDKYSYKNENNSKMVDFAHRNYEAICFTSAIIAVISGAIVATMLIFIIVAQVSAGGDMASNKQRYAALVYKAQTESIRDEFGIVNKEYIDEVQEWNEDLAKYQTYSESFWIGIFYPKRAYEGFETIDLEDIKMRIED